MKTTRRRWMGSVTAGGVFLGASAAAGGEAGRRSGGLRITGLRVTPIALPDPPLLSAGGCHGPYFLRNVVEVETEGKVVGIGETRGGQSIADELNAARKHLLGRDAFAFRGLQVLLREAAPATYAGLELACLDACGKATGRRLCDLLGGPVRTEVEFAAYLFYRFAADHPRLLEDRRIVDGRGRGDRALDDWGEVRTPRSMVAQAERFRRQWGFRVFKLKAGVLPPRQELETMQALQGHFRGRAPLRIDPNARWTVKTAVAAAKVLRDLNLEYYEDPVRGQEAMARVRRETKLPLSTNMCVTRFAHVREAAERRSVDVILGDHHFWGGIPACIELGRLCEAFGWRMSQHSNNHAGITMAAMIHVGAMVPQITLASDTHYPWLPADADILQGGKLPIRDGKMAIPRGPGLGMTLDADRLARAHETYRKCGMRERDDPHTMRMVEPGWRRTEW